MMQLLEHIHEVATPTLFGIAILAMIIESYFLISNGVRINNKGAAVSAISGAFAFGILFIANKILLIGIMYWIYNYRIWDLGFNWYTWVIALLLYDFMFYVMHRIGHEVRFFWCMHSVHHTIEEMRLTSAIRASIFDFIHIPVFFVWLPLLGIHPLMILILESFSRIYAVYSHINESFIGKQKKLELLFITPSAHRVHHGKNYNYLDMNYGEIFSIWDKLFKTWQTEEEKPVYGILSEINSNDFMEIQFRGFKDLWKDIRSAPDIKNKIKYIFMPPGWKHEGEVQTSKILKLQVSNQNNFSIK